MEIDVTKLGIAQLHQVYGELTIQLEFLSQKANQVKTLIVQKANEMQREQQEQMAKANEQFKNGCAGAVAGASQLRAVPSPTCAENGPECCKTQIGEINGLVPEAS